MGAPKLRELDKPVQLTPLRKPNDNRRPVISFITLILTLLVSTVFLTISSSEQNESTETLKEFVEETLKDTTGKKARYFIGKIPDELAIRIGVYADRNIKDYSFSIIADAIRHIESKHAGKNEKSKDQEGIKLSDYEELINTLYYPEFIEPVKTATSGARQLKFVRKVKRTYIVIVQLSNKKRTLDVNTFYIKKPPITNY